MAKIILNIEIDASGEELKELLILAEDNLKRIKAFSFRRLYDVFVKPLRKRNFIISDINFSSNTLPVGLGALREKQPKNSNLEIKIKG